MHIVTPKRLKSALSDVREEMEAHGFFDSKMEEIEVSLGCFGSAYACCYYGTSGNIRIPAISASRSLDIFCEHPYTSIPDVLRHEYGHALAHTHPRLFCSVPFKRAFGSHHDADVASDYCPKSHVTEYAATLPREDFAETFMLFLRHDGDIPECFDTPVIRRKWRFVRSVGVAVARGQRRWGQGALC